MKTGLLTAFLMIYAIGLTAQKSQYFTYDREKVNLIMEQISESNTTASAFACIADTTARRPISRFGYFTIGFIPGCLGPLAGGWLSGLLGNSNVGVIIGSTLGLVIPPLVVYTRTKNRESTTYTAFGSLVGLGTMAGVSFIMALYVLHMFTESMEDCSGSMLVPLIYHLF